MFSDSISEVLQWPVTALGTHRAPWGQHSDQSYKGGSGSTNNLQPLQMTCCKMFLLLPRCITVHLLLPSASARRKAGWQDGAWPHKLHISFITLPKKVSASPSASRDQKHFRSQPRIALVFPRDKQTFMSIPFWSDSPLSWPVCWTQSGWIHVSGGIVQLWGSTWKICHHLGLAGRGGEHQVSLWQLLVVVGYRLGTGHIRRVALSSV